MSITAFDVISAFTETKNVFISTEE
jgi:hypothetical protein